jgi:DNA-binding transcriptional MocR family regulator
MEIAASNLLITNGNSQALDTLTTVYCSSSNSIDKVASVIVEDPTYFLAQNILEDHQVKLVGVPVDKEGLQVEELERILYTHWTTPQMVYFIPQYQNPSGVNLSAERFAELFRIAAERDIVLVADEPYTLLHYENQSPAPVPALKHLELYRRRCENLSSASADTSTEASTPNPTLIGMGSFSKIFGPGLRLGWMHGAPEVIDFLTRRGVTRSGGGNNPLTAAIMYELIESGALKENLATLRRVLGARKRHLCEAIRQHLPCATFVEPDGGYFVWVRIDDSVCMERLQARAAERNVHFTSGPQCSAVAGGAAHEQWVRLAFSFHTEKELEEGVKLLAFAAKESLH